MIPTVPTRDEYIEAHVKAYFDQNPTEVFNPDRESVVKRVFLSLYDDELEVHNARKALIEVLALPTHADVAEYCRLLCASQWKMVSPDEFLLKNGELFASTFF